MAEFHKKNNQFRCQMHEHILTDSLKSQPLLKSLLFHYNYSQNSSITPLMRSLFTIPRKYKDLSKHSLLPKPKACQFENRCVFKSFCAQNKLIRFQTQNPLPQVSPFLYLSVDSDAESPASPVSFPQNFSAYEEAQPCFYLADPVEEKIQQMEHMRLPSQ